MYLLCRLGCIIYLLATAQLARRVLVLSALSAKHVVRAWDATGIMLCCASCSVQDYANAHDVKIIGDMPIYVGGQSADVWANQHLFELGESGAPDLVSWPRWVSSRQFVSGVDCISVQLQLVIDIAGCTLSASAHSGMLACALCTWHAFGHVCMARETRNAA